MDYGLACYLHCELHRYAERAVTALLVLRSPIPVVLFQVFLATSSLGAQQPALVTDSTVVAPPAFASRGPAATDSAGDSELRLRALVLTGAPRSYQVVSIEVPDQLAGASNIEIEIVPLGEFAILGQRRRVVDASGGRKPRVGITIGIPARAGCFFTAVISSLPFIFGI